MADIFIYTLLLPISCLSRLYPWQAPCVFIFNCILLMVRKMPVITLRRLSDQTWRTHTQIHHTYSILYMPHWPGHGITFGCLATQRNLIKINMRNCSYFMLFAISIVWLRKQAGRQGGRQGHVSLHLALSLSLSLSACLSFSKVTSQSRFLIMYKIRQQDSIYRYLD